MASKDGGSRSAQVVNAANRPFFVFDVVVLMVESLAKATNAASKAERVIAEDSAWEVCDVL